MRMLVVIDYWFAALPVIYFEEMVNWWIAGVSMYVSDFVKVDGF